ncbi:L,D-transpeptidase family protein [Puia sp.]|jgi:murein L,D-transpeptidase YcbB/YkuD|uniref:L,D-transpeptidase family protein n=1 Tax=Puia sp. TaxID=2045100 RepID=UPI002F42536C
MNYRTRSVLFLLPVFLTMVLMACHDKKPGIDKDEVKTPAQADEHVATDLKSMLLYVAGNGDKLNDSTVLAYRKLADSIYGSNGYKAIWSDKQRWLPAGDSLLSFIEDSKYYGLFPTDYHYNALAFYKRIIGEDTLARKNVAIWNRADILLTDAFFTLVKDLKQGRLEYDSVTLRKDSILSDSFYAHTLATARQFGVRGALDSLEPRHPGYDSLKAYLGDFLVNAHFRKLTWLDYPYKDSAVFYTSLTKRLQEVGYIDSSVTRADTATLAGALRKYQETNKLKVTGRASQETVTLMDNSDWEKFKRIAINLDRYKLLPDTLPRTYVWVDLPAFTLQVRDDDTVALESRVIVGSPKTRTPLLSSEISNFVTYPQWTVPTSIIMKEMLPAIKRNVDYLRKQNLMVVDDNDSVRDPMTINWARLNKNNFPYQLKQRQGDDNSLGVMKFNFRNKYDVYLHDTNVRWMFDNKFRALSHGCVRVQQWRKLSAFLIRNDTMRYHPDTLKSWISRQEKHTVYGFAHVPIYLRYFTAEGKKGKIQFYDDIYGEDRVLRNRYFAMKPLF